MSAIKTLIERRQSNWATKFNLTVKSIDERADKPDGDIVYMVKDIFTTRDGSWEPSNIPGSLPRWARDTYLKPYGSPDYFDDAGADHHLFAAVIGLDGQLIRDHQIVFWSDGFDKLNDSNYDGFVVRQTKPSSGWINIPINKGSAFVPERHESGPWCWAPIGASEVIHGGGLPANWHISTFVVWQAVHRSELGEEPKPSEPLTPITTIPALNVAELRQMMWKKVGIELKDESPFVKYARTHSLGMPVTAELEVGGYQVQGYHTAILYMRIGDSENIQKIEW